MAAPVHTIEWVVAECDMVIGCLPQDGFPIFASWETVDPQDHCQGLPVAFIFMTVYIKFDSYLTLDSRDCSLSQKVANQQ